MATEKNPRDQLLKQNGVGAQEGNDLCDKVLAKDRAQVTRIKRVTIYSWILVAASLIAAGIVRLAFPDVIEFRPELIPTFIIAWQALLLIAVIFTVSLYVRSRTLTMHQIQSSLALIEEHLRKMSQKD
jgi:cell division protein FtsL